MEAREINDREELIIKWANAVLEELKGQPATLISITHTLGHAFNEDMSMVLAYILKQQGKEISH